MSKNKSRKPSWKNPLLLTFGIALRSRRTEKGMTAREIADSMGIAESYYRLVESGIHTFHINKAIALTKAFEGTFDFNAVSKLLISISIFESMKKDYD